ncbi:DUF563 domain-containing protein [Caulobacter sp. UNC279MFTsu5.1]|uniref:glycosyltransferase family 61 protein n=1 Tax=Caulobacter sp. UNC279MFTsu5.1 TaxID=1502775 RepID=UPI00035D6244|nr:glycosyltransferase 61 family protein [Caulobacter sp. UNC279MFTsu5.1]SFJ46809.1 Capsular polysaccharide biosynthesis protein [Caulobacter sp. UNC279MFTsu5.1]
MTLHRCANVWGDELLLPSPPSIHRIDAAVCAPKLVPGGAYDFDAGWGVYDADGARVEAAAYRRGPGVNYVGQSPHLVFAEPDIIAAPCGKAIYGGVAHTHFGHFLVSTLARLWVAGTPHAPPGSKYVFHMDQSPAEWFALPFVAACLESLGIFRDDIIPLDRAMRFETLLVPEPSFEETRAFHPVFRETALRIGDALAVEGAPPMTAPVYLSKERLPAGVKRFDNESQMVERLRAGGVAIVYPETMTPAQQLDIFRTAPIVLGSLSSAFHTTILLSERVRFVALNHDTNIMSTFTMIDRLTANSALYVHQSAVMTQGVDPHFMATFHLPDPKGAAEDLLRIIDGDLSGLTDA